MSELLSQHVLQNYDKFVAGIDEVGLVEQDLVSAYATAKSARANLRASSTEISANIKVCSSTFFHAVSAHAFLALLNKFPPRMYTNVSNVEIT